MKEEIKKEKIGVFLILGIFIVGIIIYNLVNLQIVSGNENLYLSSLKKTSEEIERAPRGIIYSYEMKPLVQNVPSYKLIINLNELSVNEEENKLKLLSKLIERPFDEVYKTFLKTAYDENSKRKNLTFTLLSNLEMNQVIAIQANQKDLPGMSIESGVSRKYFESESFSHIVGYVKDAGEKEIASGNYTVGDIAGASGLELYYDSILKGENGKKIFEANFDYSKIREFTPKEPISGKNLKISIRYDMQLALTKALKEGIKKNNSTGGAAIIMDVNTGEILSMVSLPTFDSNMLVKGLTFEEYDKLLADETLPLTNRAIGLPQPAGSTFKVVVAASALQEGVIDKNTIVNSEGCMDLGGGFEFCEVGKVKMGKINLIQAMARSSNIYFCDTVIKLGIDKLNIYAKRMNVGMLTGIDIYGEQKGTMPSKEIKLAREKTQWYQGDSCNTAIGQGLLQVTPIQMVSWISAIANGGTYYKPHLVLSVIDQAGKEEMKFEPEIVHKLDIDKKNLDIIKEGMHAVVNNPMGTGFYLRGLKSDPCAKTGSAETYRKIDGKFYRAGHSWVSGFFPYSKPQYAFVVYLEYGGWGYKSAEIMKNFLLWYEQSK